MQRSLTLLLTALTLLPAPREACTTVAIGRLASKSGHPICSHSNDGDGDVAGTLRQVAESAHPPGSQRKTTYGSIPQVAHTFAYKTEGYAVANDFNVGLCESTCSAIFDASTGWGNRGNLSIVDLGQIALERATTAYEAVTIMGNTSTVHGYRDAGESLLVVDPLEAFIFHILPDPSNASSIWVAQRIGEDEVAVVANAFTIGEVTFPLSQHSGDDRDFLGSANLKSVAEAYGLYDPVKETVFDFSKIYSKGELGPKYNTGRRMWEAYRLLARDTKMSPTYSSFLHAYPAAVAVKHATIAVTDVFKVMRSYYQGTKYDLSKKGLDRPSDYPVAAGPTETSFRAHPGAAEAHFPDGRWERPIAIWKTQVSVVICTGLPVGDNKKSQGIVWFAPHAAHTSVYMPFLIMNAGTPPLPAAVSGPASISTVNRTYAFWANRYVFTMAQMRFALAIQDIEEARQPLEQKATALLAQLPENGIKAAALLSDHADYVVAKWWALSDQLLVWYAEGNCNGCPHSRGLPQGRYFGYPQWFLEESGYSDPLP